MSARLNHGWFLVDPTPPPESQAPKAVVAKAVAELDSVHYHDPTLKSRGGCVMCWPKDGSWPCTTRLIADELRELIADADA